MKILNVVEAKFWEHKETQKRVSPGGAAPWTNPIDKENWHMITAGWSWSMDNGTRGFGRAPAETRKEAVMVMRRFNDRLDQQDGLPHFIECGCCGDYHHVSFTGDCRDDDERYALFELDEFYGSDKWTEEYDD